MKKLLVRLGLYLIKTFDSLGEFSGPTFTVIPGRLQRSYARSSVRERAINAWNRECDAQLYKRDLAYVRQYYPNAR